jgi:hypothetical protein
MLKRVSSAPPSAPKAGLFIALGGTVKKQMRKGEECDMQV